jgi:hypothetical protein
MNNIELSDAIKAKETDEPNSICLEYIELSKRMILSKLKSTGIYRDDIGDMAVDCWINYALKKQKDPSFRLIAPLSWIKIAVLKELYNLRQQRADQTVPLESQHSL